MCYFPVMGREGGRTTTEPNEVKKKQPSSPFSSRIKVLVSKSTVVCVWGGSIFRYPL